MIPLLAVAGAECVEALGMAGFTISGRTDADTTMVKGSRVVVVPDLPVIPPEQLMEILDAAAVDYGDFLDLLSEAPTDPAISRTRLAPSFVPR